MSAASCVRELVPFGLIKVPGHVQVGGSVGEPSNGNGLDWTTE